MDGAPDPRGGQYLAGGFCGILFVVRGDLEWMNKHFALNHRIIIHPLDILALCAVVRILGRRRNSIHGQMSMTLLRGCLHAGLMRLVIGFGAMDSNVS